MTKVIFVNNINMPMSETPRTTVGVFVVNNGKILFLKRAENRGPEYRFQGYWCIPGGHVDIGETVEQAAVRETKEETGLTVKKLKFLFYTDEILPDRNWWAVAHKFIAFTDETDVKIQEDEISEYKWVTVEEALKEKLAFETKKELERLRDGFSEELRK